MKTIFLSFPIALAALSGSLNISTEYMMPDGKTRCEVIIPGKVKADSMKKSADDPNNGGLLLAKESYQRTFGIADTKDVYIKMVRFESNDQMSVQEVTYADKEKRQSTFTMVTVNHTK